MWSLKRRPGSLNLRLRLSERDGSLAPRHLFYSEPSYTTYMAARRGMFISWFRGEARPMRARDVDRTETQTRFDSHVSVRANGDGTSGCTKIVARRLCAANVAAGQHRTRARVRIRQVVTGTIPPYRATCTCTCERELLLCVGNPPPHPSPTSAIHS